MEIFNSNLKNLASSITQKQIAKDTGVSPSSIANYIAGTSEPSASFLLALKKAYKINIDSFLTTNLSENSFIKKENEEFSRFIGNYIVYYYNASAYKGKINTYNSEVLNYGIISIYEDVLESNKIKTFGLFVKSRKEVEDALRTLNGYKKDSEKIKSFYNKQSEFYYGEIKQNATELFISLENENDKCLIILNNPPSSSKKYIGGLGTVNSISRGREHAPCIQFILFSSTILHIPDGEIYNLLSLESPEIEIKQEAKEIIELFKKLYTTETVKSFTEEQKQTIIEDSISALIDNVANANMFRFAKISDIEDDSYYRIIKDQIDE